MSIRRFEDIESWQMGREVSRSVFKVARDSDLGCDFSLKDQMLRSAGSIMDNIAEGFDAGSTRGKIGALIQYLTKNLDRRNVGQSRERRTANGEPRT